MLSGRIETNGKTILIIGLTRENILRLESGKPIAMSSEKCPSLPLDTEILILSSEDEPALIERLQEAGVSIQSVRDFRKPESGRRSFGSSKQPTDI